MDRQPSQPLSVLETVPVSEKEKSGKAAFFQLLPLPVVSSGGMGNCSQNWWGAHTRGCGNILREDGDRSFLVYLLVDFHAHLLVHVLIHMVGSTLMVDATHIRL